MSDVRFETILYTKPLAHFSIPKTVDLHLHKHVEFICVITGNFSLQLENKAAILSPNDAVFIAPHTLHSYKPLTRDAMRFVLVFEPESTGSIGQILLENIPAQPIISATTITQLFPSLTATLTTLAEGCRHNDTISYLAFYSEFMRFLETILRTTGLQKKPQSTNDLFSQAVNLCNEQFTNADFNIDMLASSLYSSPSHIKQVFAKNMQMSVKKYLTMLRIGRAEILLEDASLSIAEIAQAAGFGSVRTFNRIFKEQKNITPLEYKKAICKKQV